MQVARDHLAGPLARELELERLRVAGAQGVDALRRRRRRASRRDMRLASSVTLTSFAMPWPMLVTVAKSLNGSPRAHRRAR